MRFSFSESMCPPDQYFVLARAAEQAGYTTFTLPDSICYPQHSDGTYPYTDTGDRRFLEDVPFLDPFCLIAALGATTERLRFAPAVLKLPIREPVLVAKTATSVAVLTNNRLSLGVGLSPWPEDFAVCRQDWHSRGKRMDEMIEIIRGLAGGGFYEFHGRCYDIPSLKLCPVPSRPIPILVGGHSEAALRRAARLGDGWMHAGGGDLEGMVKRLGQLRRDYGRDHLPFEIHAGVLPDSGADAVCQLQDLGVTDVVVACRNFYDRSTDGMTLRDKLDVLHRYADTVLARFPETAPALQAKAS